MTTIKTILGNRLVIRRIPPKSTIVLPPNIQFPDRTYEATVKLLGTRVTEPVKVGDKILVVRVGFQGNDLNAVRYRGEDCEMISTLDVAAVL